MREDDERRVYVCFCFYKTLDVFGLTNTYILIKIYIYIKSVLLKKFIVGVYLFKGNNGNIRTLIKFGAVWIMKFYQAYNRSPSYIKIPRKLEV